jgi:hypothetical protein
MAGLMLLAIRVRSASVCSDTVIIANLTTRAVQDASGDDCFRFVECIWSSVVTAASGGATYLSIGITHEAVFDRCCWYVCCARGTGSGGGLF